MKRKLCSTIKFKGFNAFIFNVFLFLFCATSFSQTTIVTDDFNRTALSPGGTPSLTYTSSLTGIATSGTVVTTAPDYRLQIQNGIVAGTAGKSYSMTVMPTVSNYNSTLQSNTQLVTWSFNMRHNRSSGSTMSGFGAGQWGIATILACDNANPTAATAKGYAVIMGGTNNVSTSTYDLVSFSNGLNVNTNIVSIITGITLASFKNVASIKVTYNPLTNKWNMFQKDEGSAIGTTAYPDPNAISVAAIGEVTDTAGHVNGPLANFGFLFSHGTTLNNSAFFDNYMVAVGVPTINTYYLAANSACNNLNNWWSGTDAASGTHPTDFAAANQIFNIFNTGATISADWTANGSGSKVVLGNGTTANSLVIPATAFLNGKIDVSALSTLTVSHVTTLPTFNLISPTSSVIFNGAADQVIQTGSYGNLAINTVGIGNASGALTIAGNLTISSSSTLNMGANKLLGVGTVSGTGAIKTQYSSSSTASAFPADIIWPFSVFYNSLTSVQSIVQGTYTNLDITGGGPRNLLAAVISVSGSLNAELAVCTPATSTINYTGTTPQTIGTVFPGFSMKIANSSTSGVALTASNIASITSANNIELAGNMSSGGFNQTFGAITLSGNSIITLGTGSHALNFADCSASFWDTTKTLVIKGWTGTPSASGTAGKIFIGATAAGLSTAQLGLVSFEGFAGAILLPTGELVPATLSNQNPTIVTLKHFPNPISDVLTLSNENDIAAVTIFNLIGQKVMASQPNSKLTTIDMSGLAPSVYVIEVLSEGKKAVIKVIKK
jgi:hypothetical protein